MELFQFPDAVPPLTGWFIIGLALLTALISALFGIGGGTILLAAMAMLLPPLAVIPLHGVIQLGANGGRALLMRQHIRRDLLVSFALGTGAGSIASGLLFVDFPAWMIQYLVAGFVIWSVFGKIPAMAAGKVVSAGAFTGFLTVMIGATGPFVAAFVKTLGLNRLEHVGTHAALMTLQHSIKIVVFGILGFAFAPYLFLLIMMLLSGFVGTSIGRTLLIRMPEKTFKPLLNAVLIAMALRLIWQATESALGN